MRIAADCGASLQFQEKVRDRGGAIASTRGACAPQNEFTIPADATKGTNPMLLAHIVDILEWRVILASGDGATRA